MGAGVEKDRQVRESSEYPHHPQILALTFTFTPSSVLPTLSRVLFFPHLPHVCAPTKLFLPSNKMEHEAVPKPGEWPVDPQTDVKISKDRIWVDGCFDFAHHGLHTRRP